MALSSDETVVALYDYTAIDTEELSIRKNEQLVLLDAKFTWWKVRNSNGKMGIVPSNYLRRDKSKGESLVNRIAKSLPARSKKPKGGGGGQSIGSRTDPMPTSPNMGFIPSAATPGTGVNRNPIKDEYVSKFNYEASKDDELTLVKNMKVLVLEMEGDGWWLGRDADRANSKPGWFPSNYVVKSEPCQPSLSTPPSTTPNNSDSNMTVRTLYAFNSDNPEELVFEQDETLEIIEQPSDDPEWWVARNAQGHKGLVPKNYVDIIQEDQPVSHPPSSTNYDPVCPSPNGMSIGKQRTNDVIPSGLNQVWFFGMITRSEAEKLLNNGGRNGEYLVRGSETSTGDYSISMKMPGRIRHFKVTSLDSGEFKIGQRTFESLDSLLDHYKRAPIYTSQEQGKVFLTTPLPH